MDAKKPTDYNRNDWDIQEFFFFACAVAGKNSEQTAQKVEALKERIHSVIPEAAERDEFTVNDTN